MHEGKRPGGLTALAVVNFIGSGYDVLSVLGVVAMILFGGQIAEKAEIGFKEQAMERARQEGRDPAMAELEPEQRQAVAALREYEKGVGAILQAVGLASCAAILLAAGIGYLRQRRWGRFAGNVYAVVSVASTIHAMNMVPHEAGGGFRFIALLLFLYPALTLYFVNVTFREDLAL